MSDQTRRGVICGVAVTLLAGCQTTTTPDGTAPVAEAIAAYHSELDNVTLREIQSIDLQDDHTAEAKVRVLVSGGEPVTATVVVTHDDNGWVVSDTAYPSGVISDE